MRLVLLAALALPACTYTRPFDPADAYARDALNRRAARAVTSVRLVSGERAAARGLLLSADSASWAHPSAGGRRAVPVEEVAAVRVEVRPGAGIRDGILIGAGAGLALGLTALLGPRDGRQDALWAPFAAAQLGLLGGIIGGVVGSRDEYVLAR